MSMNEFLLLWGAAFASIFACRTLPYLLLHGRALSPRVVDALGYIPPAAFAALVANDLFQPDAFSQGIWPAALPLAAAAIVALIALRTRSMLWCCVAGVASYLVLSLLA